MYTPQKHLNAWELLVDFIFSKIKRANNTIAHWPKYIKTATQIQKKKINLPTKKKKKKEKPNKHLPSKAQR